MFHLRQDSPLRPPDWRWEKAKLLRQDARHNSRTLDDKLISDLMRFQDRLEEAEGVWDKYRLLRQYPQLTAVWEIREHEAAGQKGVKAELEARILSGAKLDAISQRLSISVDTIELYEKVFFNVLDRLSNRGFIAHNVFGRAIQAPINEREYELLWKLFSYSGGPGVLDAVIDGWVDPKRAEIAAEAPEFFDRQASHLMRKRACIAALTIQPHDAYTKAQVLEVYARYRELEQQIEGGAPRNTILLNLRTMLENLPWGQDLLDNPAAMRASRIVSNAAAELRASEVLAHDTGMGTSPDLDGLKQITFEGIVDERSRHEARN